MTEVRNLQEYIKNIEEEIAKQIVEFLTAEYLSKIQPPSRYHLAPLIRLVRDPDHWPARQRTGFCAADRGQQRPH